MLEKIVGKKSEDISIQQLQHVVTVFSRVHVDLGTGDGLWVWRQAREEDHSNCFFLGIDADRASLAEGSARCAKKPARGGAVNAMFVCANVFELPESLCDFADSISINFPWGSLMMAVATGDKTAFVKFARLCKNGAKFKIYLNLQVFQDEAQRQRMDLDDINSDYVEKVLIPTYAKSGFIVDGYEFKNPEDLSSVKSTWAGRLLRRSKRETLVLEGRVVK